MHGAELGRGALLLVVQALDVLGLVGVNCLKVFDFLLQCVQFLFRSESLLRELLFEGHEAELGVLGGASFTTQKSLVRSVLRACHVRASRRNSAQRGPLDGGRDRLAHRLRLTAKLVMNAQRVEPGRVIVTRNPTGLLLKTNLALGSVLNGS